MKKKKKSFRKSRNQHSKERALERYGLKLNHSDIQKAIAKISGKKAVFIRRRSWRVGEWVVEVRGESLRVLYDKNHHCLATVLPMYKKVSNATQAK